MNFPAEKKKVLNQFKLFAGPPSLKTKMKNEWKHFLSPETNITGT